MTWRVTNPPGRTVSVVLTTPDGAVFGRLPPVAVATPWWPDVAPIVGAIRDRDGLDVVILRLLHADRPHPPGGTLTYLAEVPELCAAEPWAGTIEDDPRRMSYARPGGPAADLAWAQSVMAANGIEPAGKPEQVRSWNLSSLWRLPSSRGALWLKVLPPFFAQEGRILSMLSGYPTPRVLASEGPRILMHEIPGEDLHDAEGPILLEMIDILVRLQADWVGREADLLAAGAPDWRAPVASSAIASVVDRAGAGLAAGDRALLDRLVVHLPQRFAAIEACGLPPTLVHGDFHPGNFRGASGSLVLLDFADSIVGHPLLDMAAFLTRVRPQDVLEAREKWFAAWRAAIPSSDPERAADLLAPIAAARQAAIYQAFLDAIEPSEHPYHQGDPRAWLDKTVDILRSDTAA